MFRRLRLLRDAQRPYEVDDPTGPTSAYGRTKLAGELAVRELLPDASYVVRTAWVYGATGGTSSRRWLAWNVSVTPSAWSTTSAGRRPGRATSRPHWSSWAAAKRPGHLPLHERRDTTWFGLTQAIFEELGADPERVLPTRHRRVSPSRAAAGLLGAVRRGVARGRTRADAAVARALHAAFAVSGDEFAPRDAHRGDHPDV